MFKHARDGLLKNGTSTFFYPALPSGITGQVLTVVCCLHPAPVRLFQREANHAGITRDQTPTWR
jgi:hypothetical protein